LKACPTKRFYKDCFRLRSEGEEGEHFWKEMMDNKERITLVEFEMCADTSSLLEDDETLEDFVADDPDHAFYSSRIGNEEVCFIQTAGFEFIFRGEK